MEDRKTTKYLSEVIDYEKDIEPYKLIQIYAGVGSGKNYWVQTLAEQGMNVLFITSRKITAEVQDANIKGIKVDLEKWHRHTLNGEPIGGDQYVVSRTNAWIEYFARHTFDPKNTVTHIWKYFDLIFLDEAHSVVTDATFADSSFQVWRFMSWVVKQATTDPKSKCRVILMSGTPEPLKQLIPKKTREQEWYNYIDCFEQCNHVEPKTVILRYEEKTKEAARVIRKYFKKEIRVIYFASSIGHILSLIEDLKKLGITEASIGVSYSKEERDKDFSKDMLDKKKRIEDSLQTEELLPDDVKIFLTTTKNKEGINIQNDDIKIMLAESSQRAELVQMAGRVRKGLNELNVMYCLAQNYDDDVKKWQHYLSMESIQHVTDKVDAFTCKNEKPTKKQVIADTERSFPYIRFDFFRQRFQFFDGKKEGEALAIRDKFKIDDWISHWTGEVMAKNGAQLPPGKESFQEWFPYSIVRLADETLSDDGIRERFVKEYFMEHSDLLDKVISKEVRDNILAELNEKLKEHNCDMKQLKSLLEKGGYTIEDKGHKKDKYTYIITKILENATENETELN